MEGSGTWEKPQPFLEDIGSLCILAAVSSNCALGIYFSVSLVLIIAIIIGLNHLAVRRLPEAFWMPLVSIIATIALAGITSLVLLIQPAPKDLAVLYLPLIIVMPICAEAFLIRKRSASKLMPDFSADGVLIKKATILAVLGIAFGTTREILGSGHLNFPGLGDVLKGASVFPIMLVASGGFIMAGLVMGCAQFLILRNKGEY